MGLNMPRGTIYAHCANCGVIVGKERVNPDSHKPSFCGDRCRETFEKDIRRCIYCKAQLPLIRPDGVAGWYCDDNCYRAWLDMRNGETQGVGTDCPHLRFEATSAVTVFLDDGSPSFLMDVQVKCADCGTPFQFVGLPEEPSMDSPSVGTLGHEARLPIIPARTARTRGKPEQVLCQTSR
jgi:endogenous inhibitor of DNA gyrase (YacG/DUF329 family)